MNWGLEVVCIVREFQGREECGGRRSGKGKKDKLGFWDCILGGGQGRGMKVTRGGCCCYGVDRGHKGTRNLRTADPLPLRLSGTWATEAIAKTRQATTTSSSKYWLNYRYLIDQKGRNRVYKYLKYGRYIVVRRVIPSDNSCLFNAVGYVMDHDKKKAPELRQEKKYSERALLIYDGLHYDALAVCDSDDLC
ncbi:unnamed protein product [Prunus armeniaca]